MSIKIKIPLIMLSALLLNIGILLAFFSFSLSPRVETYQMNMQQTVSSTAQEIVTQINGESFTQAASYLSSLDNPKKLSFILTNTQSGKETKWNNNTRQSIGFSQVGVLSLSDQPYVLEVKKQVELLNFRTHGIFQELLYFEIGVLIVIFLLVGFVIHFRYVSSLLKLNLSMQLYKGQKKIPRKDNRKDEIGRLQTSFTELSESLEEEKQTQNRIISSISHDIKTPLTSVLGYSERLLTKDLDLQRQKQYIRTIYTQAHDIEAIVDEFDDYLSASLSHKDQNQPYSIAYLSTMLVDEYQARLNEQGINFVVHNYCDSEATICGDLLKLRRVFANIIGNSIRHARTANLYITVTFTRKSNLLFINVSDNGHGISERDLPHIFEPFYTSDQSRRISGLGLSICKQMVESHGGTVTACNRNEGGLLMQISLPLC